MARVWLLLGLLLPLLAQAPQVAQVDAYDLRVQVPNRWQSNTAVLQAGGPISLNSFNHSYIRGGIIPDGGAEIEITRVAAPSQGLGPYARAEMGTDVTTVRTEERSVQGAPAIRVEYSEQFAPELSYTTVTYFVLRGQRLYKFYLTYHQDDAGAAAHQQAFEALVEAVAWTN